MTQATVTITGSEEIVTAGDKKFRVVLVPCEDEKPEYVECFHPLHRNDNDRR